MQKIPNYVAFCPLWVASYVQSRQGTYVNAEIACPAAAFIDCRVQQSLYTILGKKKTAIHLPSLREQAFPFLHIVILRQRKNLIFT